MRMNTGRWAPLLFALVCLPAVSMARTPVGDTSNGADSSELDEITVSAPKWSATSPDYSGAVTTLRADNINQSNLLTIGDASRLTPGLSIMDTGARNPDIVLIRGLNFDGVGANDLGGDSNTVATYVNSIPMQGYYTPPQFLLKDLDRIDVLRGPQGTLYGTSSLAGVVNYQTAKPSLSENLIQIGSQISSTAHSASLSTDSEIVANSLLAPNATALRGMISYRDTSGFINNDTLAAGRASDLNNERESTARISVLHKPDETLQLDAMLQKQDTFAGDRQADNVIGRGREYVATARNRQPSDNKLLVGEVHAGYRWSQNLSTDLFVNHYELNQKQKTDLAELYAAASSPSQYAGALRISEIDVSQQTAELRISTSSARTSSLLGVFFSDNDLKGQAQDNLATVSATTPQLAYSQQQQLKDAALFGETTVLFGEHFQATLGGRYFSYHDGADSCYAGDAITFECYGEQLQNHHVSFKLAGLYEFNSDVNIYANIGQGFRRGGANPGVPDDLAGRRSYDPDTSIDYDLGLRGESSNGRVWGGATLFYIDWSDVQVITSENSPDLNLPVAFIANARDAESSGIELEFAFDLNPNFIVAGNYTFTDAHLQNDAISFNNESGGGNNAYKNDRLPGSPRNKASLSGELIYPRGNISLSTNLAITYVGNVTTQLNDEHPDYRVLDSYTLLDLYSSLSFQQWKLRFFIQNIENKRIVQGYSGISYLGEGGEFEYVNRPRTFALGATITFL